MKTITIILITLSLLFVACSQDTPPNKEEYKYISVGSFNYALGAYKIKFGANNYLILLNENDFYYFLESIGKVKGKLDYFNNREKILESPVAIDSTTFSNFKSDIIFVDSCDKVLVNEWIQKIKNNPKNLDQPINVDNTVSRINLNNIYYGLIKDSFKIYQEDASGNYVLRR